MQRENTQYLTHRRILSFIPLVTAMAIALSAADAFSQPINNNAANATPVAIGDNITDNRGATNSTPASCAQDADVWYRFDAASANCSAVVFDLSLDIILPSPNYQPTLAIYDSQGINEIACDNSSPPSISFPANPTTYLIRVGGLSGSTGTAHLIINCSGPNTIPGHVWNEVAQTGPPARYDHAMTYDLSRQRVLMFGGRSTTQYFNDLWTWNNTTRNWSNLNPGGVIPAPRYGHTIAFDRINDQLVLFGGYTPTGYSNETFVYDPQSNNWSLAPLTTSPPARYYHGMVHDHLRGEFVLYGGTNGGTTFGDTWVWDGQSTQWQFKTTLTCPATLMCARYNFAMAFQPNTGQTAIFGGTDGPNCFDDTFFWNGSGWNGSGQPGPSSRFAHDMVFDTYENRLLLHGGTTIVCQPGGGAVGDTYTRQSTWSPETTNLSLPRFGHAMAFDEVAHAVVLFGGASNTTLNQNTYLGERGIPNDNEAGAIPVVSSTTYALDALAATDGPAGCANGADLWYRYTATCTGQVTISLTGATFLPELAIYQGYPSAGTPLICDTSTASSILATIPVASGQQYTIRVGAQGGAGGRARLNVLACDPLNCPPPASISSQTQFLVWINGNASGQPWAWCIDWLGGLACDYHVPGVAPGGTAADLAAAWVASIQSHHCHANNKLSARQLPAPNDNMFTITIGGNQPYLNVSVGPANQVPTCYLNPYTPCPFNPDAYQILLSGEDCDANGEDDTIDILFDASLDTNDNGHIDACEAAPGDVNCDDRLDGRDVGTFVLALTDPERYTELHEGCPLSSADLDGDQLVTTADIEPFILALLEGE